MRILYFAWLAERLGTTEANIQLPENVQNCNDLRQWLQQQHPDQAAILADSDALRVAVNQQLVTWQHPITDRDEVALFPPMTGG